MADSKSGFLRLRDVDSSFQNRSSSIFDGLNILEPSSNNSAPSKEDETVTNERRNSNKVRNRRLPARVPQHILSPEKWTKYNLENDGTAEFRGLNEHSLNKHAAHSFLADLKKRKSVESNAQGSKPDSGKRSIGGEPKRDGAKSEVKASEQISKANSEGAGVVNVQNDSKLLFKKPEPKPYMTSSNLTGIWKEGTYIMPEYVVGLSQSKNNPRMAKSSGVKAVADNSPVNLEHLGDECADDMVLEVEKGKMRKVTGKRNFRKRKADDESEQNED